MQTKFSNFNLNSRFFKKGIRLRLTIIFSTLFLVLTFVISSIILFIESRALEKKSFEVCALIEIGLSAISREAISTDNLIVLQDVVKNIKDSNVSGLTRIDIYSIPRNKHSNKYSEQKFEIIASTDLKHLGLFNNDEYGKYIAESKETKKAKMVSKKNEEGEKVFYFLSPVMVKIAGQEKWVGLISIEYLRSSITESTTNAILISSLLSILILGIAVYIIHRVGGNITAPILQIADASKKVGSGDFQIQLDIKTRDELEQLANDFNKMVKGLNQKIKMEKFISNSAAEMISKTDIKDEITRSGSKEDIAFLFSDVRGFTSMSEKKTPEQVVEILNHYLDMQSIIIKDNGGDIDKYVGDEIMAVFRGSNRRYNAIKAAVEIQEAMQKSNIERQKLGEQIIQIGVGLNDGEAIFGSMGSRFRMDYTCIGDSVNLAARLCSAAEGGSVIASSFILENADLKNQFKAEALPPIKVKGKEKPIDIYKMSRIYKLNTK